MFFVAFEIFILVFYCIIFYLRYFHFVLKKMEGREGARCLIAREWRFYAVLAKWPITWFSNRLISTHCVALTHETNL